MMQNRTKFVREPPSDNPFFDRERSAHLMQSLHAIAEADGKVSAEEMREINEIAAEFGVDASVQQDLP